MSDNQAPPLGSPDFWRRQVNDMMETLLKTDNRDPNVEAVRAKLLERSQVGIRKYGVTTSAAGLTPRDWMKHLQEELMDAAVYVEAALRELDRERGVTLYAFKFCDCVFESGYETYSLHATKRGAYRAMNAHLWAQHEDYRNGPHTRSIFGAGWKPFQFKAWRVEPVEVLP